MNNLARSRAVVTALLAVCPEFRERRTWWFPKVVPNGCPSCGRPLHGTYVTPPYEDLEGGYRCQSCRIMHSSEYNCQPPDLLAPAHLADLFEVCDALGLVLTTHQPTAVAEARFSANVDGHRAMSATSRQEALMRAAEAALDAEMDRADG
jgi:hypothetical protein